MPVIPNNLKVTINITNLINALAITDPVTILKVLDVLEPLTPHDFKLDKERTKDFSNHIKDKIQRLSTDKWELQNNIKEEYTHLEELNNFLKYGKDYV